MEQEGRKKQKQETKKIQNPLPRLATGVGEKNEILGYFPKSHSVNQSEGVLRLFLHQRQV
jgi:hypothetical protein